MLVVAATCVRLGFWQLSRLEQRKARNEALVQRIGQQTLAADQLSGDTGQVFSSVLLRGRFDDSHTFILANRTLRGLPGVYVFTPFRVRDRPLNVLVNRGWFPAADGTTVDFDSIRTTTADTVVYGVILPFHEARRSGLDTARAFRRTWFQFDHARMRAQLSYRVLPYYIQLHPRPGERSFPIRLQPPEPDNGPHLGYAIQWFSFALIGLGGWLALVLRRDQKRKREDQASRS